MNVVKNKKEASDYNLKRKAFDNFNKKVKHLMTSKKSVKRN